MQISAVQVSSTLSRLKLAYKKSQVYLQIRLIGSFAAYAYFFRCLRAWGVISHYEFKAQNIFSKRALASCEFRLFLRYRDKKPAVSFWSFAASSKATHALSAKHLHRLAWYQPGISFIVRTSLGFLPLQESLAHKSGGSIFMAIRAA